MHGTDGRGSDRFGSSPGAIPPAHGEDAGPHVIRADFAAHATHRDAPEGGGGAPIPFDGEAPDGDAPSPEVMAARAAARNEMVRLRVEHRDLDEAIAALGRTVCDQLQLQRLKRRKLAMRDRIRQLEDQLTPDIIA